MASCAFLGRVALHLGAIAFLLSSRLSSLSFVLRSEAPIFEPSTTVERHTESGTVNKTSPFDASREAMRPRTPRSL